MFMVSLYNWHDDAKKKELLIFYVEKLNFRHLTFTLGKIIYNQENMKKITFQIQSRGLLN